MPNLFNGYCYATISEAASAEISQNLLVTSSGVVSPSAFTASTAIAGNLTIQYKPLSGTVQSSYLLYRTYPSCANVGYLTNYSGIELVDAVAVSWLVILVWVTAFVFKSMRRPIR